LLWIIASTFIVSAVSLAGIVTLAIKKDLLAKILFGLVGFSAGAMLGGAFLHILPEAMEKNPHPEEVFSLLIAGIVLFFLLEKYFHWRHCHQQECRLHAFTYLNLVGDGLHNFLDGMLIAAGFLVSLKLGIVTAAAVILHEIPQELGDFAVLVYGGFSRQKALFFNFLSGLTAIAGALAGYFICVLAGRLSLVILPFAAGGFIYIAGSDLIPELHKETSPGRSLLAFTAFLLGIFFMAFAKRFLPD